MCSRAAGAYQVGQCLVALHAVELLHGVERHTVTGHQPARLCTHHNQQHKHTYITQYIIHHTYTYSISIRVRGSGLGVRGVN